MTVYCFTIVDGKKIKVLKLPSKSPEPNLAGALRVHLQRVAGKEFDRFRELLQLLLTKHILPT